MDTKEGNEMSVLKDLVTERLNWGRHHRAVVAQHQLFILVGELVILAGVTLLCILYHEAIVLFFASLGG